MAMNNNNNTLDPSLSKISINSIVNHPRIEKENSSPANIQIISFDSNRDSTKKRKFDEFDDSNSLDEFRKFKSSFPSIKYQRIWDGDCSSPLVYIS